MLKQWIVRLITTSLTLFLFQAFGFAPSVLFTVSNAPPPGFVAAAKPQKILIDVQYEGRYLGTYPAIISPTTIRFVNPLLFLNKIPQLKEKYLLAKTLAKTAPNHSAAICQNLHTTNSCGVLFPAMIGVIYDPNNFVANLFINQNYLNQPKNSSFRLLPNSSSGWSYTNAISTFLSGNNNQNSAFNTNIDTENNNYSSFTTDSVLAYKNNRANFSLSYNNPLAGGNQVLINQADIERDHGKHSYAAGLIQTNGSQFFPNISILGVQYATTLNTMPNALNASSTPLIIFINLPSQVSIFKDGQLIYSKFLPGGYQKINTSNFPEGAYQLTVKTVDSQGNTNTRQYYYVKTNQLPPLHLPQYSITTGDEVASPQFDSSNSTQLLNIPVYQFNYSRRLDNTIGVGINSIGSDKNAYLAAGPIWVYGPTQLSTGLLVGTQNSLGASTNISYTLNKFGAGLNYLQLFTNNRSQNSIDTNSPNYYYDRLLTFNDKQIDGTVDYALNDTTIFNIIGIYGATPGCPSTYSYGLSLTKTLAQFNDNQLLFTMGANRSNTDFTINANLVFTFDAPKVNASLQTGYLYQNDVSPVIANVNNSGLQTSGNINWFSNNSNQYGYNVGLHGITSTSSKNVGTTYQNINKYSVISGYANYNNTQGYGGTTQYGGELNSQLNWTPKGTTISNGAFNHTTGVIVYVNSPDSNSSFIVHTAMQPGFNITANRAYFIPLAPYQQYDIQISNNSDKLYSFTNPEHVVTLYPGNIQTLHWHAVLQKILIGRLLTPTGKPITDAELTAELGNSFTDDNGYFQVNTTAKNPKVLAAYGNNHCQLKLPAINANSTANDYLFLGDVICVPVQSSSHF